MTDRDKKIYERLKHDEKYVKNLGYEVGVEYDNVYI